MLSKKNRRLIKDLEQEVRKTSKQMIYPLNFSFSLSLLFMGFLLSNIFGILGSSKSIVFLFILCIELINCFVYTRKTKKVYGIFTSLSQRDASLLSVRRKGKQPLSPFLSSFPSFLRTRSKKGKGVAKQRKGGKNADEIAMNRFFLSSLKKFFIPIFFYLSYKVSSKEQQIEDQIPKFKDTFLIPFVLNFFKIGFEFGFFVDAFKLGS